MWLYIFIVVLLVLIVVIVSAFADSSKKKETDANLAAKYIPPQSSPWKGEKFMVIVNPVSGAKKSLEIWKNIVKPMLDKASINYELFITEHATHVKEQFSKDRTILDNISCILTISGDGILHDLLNALVDRGSGDAETLVKLLELHSLAIIPGGTSNGLTSSFGSSSPYQATKRIIEGKKNSMDVMEIQFPNHKSRPSVFDVHAITWGLTADAEAFMNELRYVQPPAIRIYVSAIYHILKNKLYHGKFRFHPFELTEEQMQTGHYYDYRKLPKDPENSGWRELDSTFTLFVVMNASHGTSDMIFAPHSKISEGAVDVVVVEGGSHLHERIMFLLNLDKGAHIHQKAVKMFKVKEFILDPITPGGILDSSGEKIPYEPIHVKIHPSSASFIF